MIRLYALTVGPLLAGPVTTLPFALLGAYLPAELPAVVGRIRRRLAEAPPTSRPKDVWAAARFLLDRRYTPQQLEALMLTDAELEQTATYQRIIKKGRTEGLARGLTEGLNKGQAEGLRQTLTQLGTQKFGPPPRATKARLAAGAIMGSFEQTQRLLAATRWVDVFTGD